MVFERQIATAKRLILKNGKLVTWRKIAIPAGDNDANPSAGVITDYPVTIAFFPNQQLNLLTTLSMLKGTEIPSGDVYGLMGAVTFTPALVDQVLGSPYGDLGIVDKNGIDEFNPNGETIFFLVRFTR